jgi:hypothetical protein
LTPTLHHKNPVWLAFPVIGTVVFAVLYSIAAFLYPGGSQANINSVGFSWMDNYWCNLLNESALNGEPNPAKPVAIAAMGILCITLSVFWFILPLHIKTGKRADVAVQLSGIAAMVTAFFLSANLYHDLVINLALLFGFIAIAGTLAALYKIAWYGLLAFGCLNVLGVGLNCYLYYTESLIVYLPLVQKISFAGFLIWICWINLKLYYIHKRRLSLENNG